MKYLSILILAFSLQGCYQMVDQSDIHRAIKTCGTIENIQFIQSHLNGEEVFKCIKSVKDQDD